MLKSKLLSVIIVLSLFGAFATTAHVEKKKDRLSNIRSSIKCFYSQTNSILQCDGGNIECPTYKNFTGQGTDKFTDFAISFVPNQEEVTLPELVKFYLYPRVENQVYRNYTIQIGFKFHRFSIYYSQDMFDDGFRVKNLTCYSKLVNYFRQNTEDQVINVKEENTNEKIKAFGFLSQI